MVLTAGTDGETMSVQTGRESVNSHSKKNHSFIDLKKVISSHLLLPPKQAHNCFSCSLLSSFTLGLSPAGLK